MPNQFQFIDANNTPYDVVMEEDALNSGSLIPISGLKDTQGNWINPATIEKQDEIINAISNDKSSTNAYQVSFTITPTTLTAGLIFFITRNPHPSIKKKLRKIEVQGFFTGTNAASRSLFDIVRFSGVTDTTGTVVPISARDTTPPDSVVEAKSSATGLTATGAVHKGNIAQVGYANQLTSNISIDFEYTERPMILRQNDAIAIRSNGTIVLGANLIVTFQWDES